MRSLRRVAICALTMFHLASAAESASAEDNRAATDFARGYVTALLATEFEIEAERLDLDDRELRIVLDETAQPEIDRLARALLGVPGVSSVQIFRVGVSAPLLVLKDEPGSEVPKLKPEGIEPGFVLFPREELFDPLLSDPRWPRFAVSHLSVLGDPELERVGAASFGETFAFVRREGGKYGDWEIGLQAGVFSVFDLEAESLDLINSDFLVALFFSQRIGPVSFLLRVAHQSSHLGDEFLLRTQINRVNLSFETLDALVSLDATNWLRLYAGGGLLVHREPRLDRGLAQAGVALRSPRAMLGGHLRPIAALDLQFRDESSWRPDVSLRWGFQIEHAQLRRMRVQVLGEYYRGRSPNGQFFSDPLESVGFGLHLGF